MWYVVCVGSGGGDVCGGEGGDGVDVFWLSDVVMVVYVLVLVVV